MTYDDHGDEKIGPKLIFRIDVRGLNEVLEYPRAYRLLGIGGMRIDELQVATQVAHVGSTHCQPHRGYLVRASARLQWDPIMPLKVVHYQLVPLCIGEYLF